MTDPLIGVAELATALAGPRPPVVLDVRWQLAGPPGRDEYVRGHIPGAVFADLDTALADPPGSRGRHPLPSTDRFGEAMRRCGITRDSTVIVYDAATSMSAARAWWLLRYFGHPSVAVLDGGIAAWVAAGHDLSSGVTVPALGDFQPVAGAMGIVDAGGAAVLAASSVLIDARAAERYRGDVEPVDPVAGHIPGAISLPTAENVGPDGAFLSATELRSRFMAAGVGEATRVGAYCGSGVTAAHEILALEIAGFSAALYPGSWSEWVTDPTRPVSRG